MWREQFDYFWDGERRLAIGCFDGAERAPAPAARPELTVVSAKDEAFAVAPTLIDVIDATRWRARICLLDVPADHRHVSLSAPDGAELRLALTPDKEQAPTGGEWRLLMTLLPDAGGADPATFKLAALSARGDFERLSREQAAQSGARLVWAIGQRRVIERGDSGALLARLWPARRVFPAYQSRIALEATNLEAEPAADVRAAPFAIMEHWLREQGAPRVTLRLRIPDSLEESAALLNRASVAFVMHQRRRLRDWMQEQKAAGEPIIDPLTFDDIRQATAEPTEHPDAVESSEPTVVANLLSVLTDAEEADADGVAVRRVGDKNAAAVGMGETFEIDFYGAALGDDVGVICSAAEAGDIGVAPVDPGGAPYARLFRVEGDGLKPRRVGDEDPLLDELMRRAAEKARAPTNAASRAVAERAAGLQGRRDKLIASLNAALSRGEYSGRFDATGAWDALEPLAQASFAALVVESSAPQRARIQELGGYRAYRADPSLAAALARSGEAADMTTARAILSYGAGRMKPSLLYRFAAACGAEGVAPPGLDAEQQTLLWRFLTQDVDVAALRASRVSLAPDATLRRESLSAAHLLADEASVERAVAHFDEQGPPEAAEALRDYLDVRRAGRWTPLDAAVDLAGLAARAGAERQQAEALAETEAAAPPASPEKPKGFFSAMRGFFGRG